MVRTAWRPSFSSAARMESGHTGSGPSTIGPANTRRGPSGFPSATLCRHCRCSGKPNMMRTPVTPLAVNSGSDGSSYQCTCMSQRPGIRNLPPASATCAPCGTAIRPVLPSSLMRPFLITTVIPGSAGAAVAFAPGRFVAWQQLGQVGRTHRRHGHDLDAFEKIIHVHFVQGIGLRMMRETIFAHVLLDGKAGHAGILKRLVVRAAHAAQV